MDESFRGGLSARLPMFLLTLLALLLPAFAVAAGGESVELRFTSTDKIYLYISLGFGALALIMGWVVSKMVLSHSPGNEKMQEVGQAIKDGALAYLRKQIGTMSIFIVLLSVGLFALYMNTYGTLIAALIALSFVGGVAASYIAGYVGMLMAINGNTRTAHAALTSYARSLEIAFRSGAVAGLITVGMGLVGATLIFLLAGGDAMKLLIGFGFGGSLAALFMRVGGGIYTKAADVGADLVGKVEAGIPEDDPRNPAVIADNVGDNVGDCAGMAADVFESYEVTLVAAIVLGAATAAIFDQPTWMKLVLFALMARGVGILASIFGILTVRGNDDLDSDPLKAIRGGFFRSAFLAAVLTGGLAWLMMSGQSPIGRDIVTSKLVPAQEYQMREMRLIKTIQADIAKKTNRAVAEVGVEEVQKDPRAKEAGLGESEQIALVTQLLNQRIEDAPVVPDMAGFTKIDWSDRRAIWNNYAATKMQLQGPIETVTFREAYEKANLEVLRLQITTSPPQPPAERGKPTPPKRPDIVRITNFGPVPKAIADEQLKMAAQQGIKVQVLGRYPVSLFATTTGRIMAAVDTVDGKAIPTPHRTSAGTGLTYYAQSLDSVKRMEEAQRAEPSKPLPQPTNILFGTVDHSVVPWWTFGLCIFFGILMAFAFELLTDYYVSTHKKPVREVAEVASAGPAPMIIQGFAYAKESSVFSLFAIVICLILPLLVFPPAVYGSYLLSFYGIALVGLGLLTTTGYILAMDTFGPISDNAQGVFEMSGAGHDNPAASRAVQRLDAAGNTTKALTKGFAIATAVVAAVALFHSYIEGAKLTGLGLPLDIPEIFLGLMIGGAAPYLFSAFTINAVGRASFQLIGEVRRQFRADPGIMAGTSKPDYGRCVAIVTAAAQKELLGPGILAIAMPMAVAFGFSIGKEQVSIGGQQYNLVGAQALGGFLAGTIISGQLMAVLLANAGGMWDNAKKLIEDGMHGGKGTEAHKAAVVCDTVGDPFKDTAGPALNPLIKVMNLVALLLVPVIIQPFETPVLIAITSACVVALGVAFYLSKKGSLASGLVSMTSESGQKAVGSPTETVGVGGKDEDRV
jgi:K(+)-stimulated pyrophosphate-energized sodium pump